LLFAIGGGGGGGGAGGMIGTAVIGVMPKACGVARFAAPTSMMAGVFLDDIFMLS